MTPAGQRDALEPVRAAMLGRARERADAILARARAQAADDLARARAQAGDQVEAARQAGRAQAGPLAAAERNRARRDARSVLLGARREALEELRRQVQTGAAALRDEPAYPGLLERLAQRAQRLAGPGAAVGEDPAGGVVARGAGVVVDLSLPRLAEAAVDALGSGVEELWT